MPRDKVDVTVKRKDAFCSKTKKLRSLVKVIDSKHFEYESYLVKLPVLLLVIYTFILNLSKPMINIIISVKGIQKISDRLYIPNLILQEKQQVPYKLREACKLH